jgi:hypothetical protein
MNMLGRTLQINKFDIIDYAEYDFKTVNLRLNVVHELALG